MRKYLRYPDSIWDKNIFLNVELTKFDFCHLSEDHDYLNVSIYVVERNEWNVLFFEYRLSFTSSAFWLKMSLLGIRPETATMLLSTMFLARFIMLLVKSLGT